jgi:tetratricopeptide (TPR) repeat protein
LVRLSPSEDLVPDLLEEIYPRLTAIGASPVVAQSKASCEWKLTMAVAQIGLGLGKSDDTRWLDAVDILRSLIADDRCAANREAVARANLLLGGSLQMLADRDSGTARLEEAITVYHEAMKDWPRERAPLEWAETQESIASALWEIADREDSTTRYEEAMAAYHETLKERTRERAPLDWARTQASGYAREHASRRGAQLGADPRPSRRCS